MCYTYVSELRKRVLILVSIHSSTQQDLIMRNDVLYGFIIIITIRRKEEEGGGGEEEEEVVEGGRGVGRGEEE